MLTFFRRIRKGLLDGGATSKYLLYAIGEIALVVIGILIALQINNWNEDRKQVNLETQYLARFKVDMASDTVYYNRRISDSEGIIGSHKQFVQESYQKQRSIEEVRKLWRNISWNSEQLTIQNSAYSELINSGLLNVLSSQILKERIINYYKQIEQATAHILEFNEVTTRHLIHLGNIMPNRTRFESVYDNLFENGDFPEVDWVIQMILAH